MTRKPKKPAPRIGRKDLQDPDRDVPTPRKDSVERDAERSDRKAGAGRPVQLDEKGRPVQLDENGRPQPADDAPVPK